MRRPGLGRVRAAHGERGNNCSRWALRSILPGMEHFHVWVRSGKIYSMQERRFDSRTTAHKAAVKLRQEKTDRLVLACASCPTTKPSKRRPPRWSVVARAVAARFDLKPVAVREVLTEALEAERERPTTPRG